MRLRERGGPAGGVGGWDGRFASMWKRPNLSLGGGGENLTILDFVFDDKKGRRGRGQNQSAKAGNVAVLYSSPRSLFLFYEIKKILKK